MYEFETIHGGFGDLGNRTYLDLGTSKTHISANILVDHNANSFSCLVSKRLTEQKIS